MLTAKNETNQSTDWWFIYKIPEHSDSKKNEGYEYLYYDENTTRLALSKNTLDKENGALHFTLCSIFNRSIKDIGYITYNDETIVSGHANPSKGHCKGVIAFNKKENSGILLLHSVPRFPFKGETTLPRKEKIYGQTFFCITLPDYSTANLIASQMLEQQDPQILTKHSYLPDNIESSEALSQLYHQTSIKEVENPSTIKFKSKSGKHFQLIAKSKKWGKDFWIDLVSPTLGVDLDVESWRRGTVTESKDKGITEEVKDAIQIDLTTLGYSNYTWKYTKDHSKWAVSEKDGDWVCVGDINRTKSQEKRGGGSICFKESKLWKALRSIAAVLKEE